MDTKTRPIYMLSTRNHFRPEDTHRLKVRGWKNIFHANGKQKKAGVAILISDKIEGFPCGSAVKESAFNTGDLGSIPGLGRSPGEGKDYPFQ